MMNSLADWFFNIDPTVFGFLAAVFGYMANRNAKGARRHAQEINDAVNPSHEAGSPRIFDLALENHSRLDNMETRLIDLAEFLADHDQWERETKYSQGDDDDE